jgi:hypothetical protein
MKLVFLWALFKTNIIKTPTVYRTCNFTMMNNILGTEELNRKQSNITQQTQYLPINNKGKHIQIIGFKKVKVNFIKILTGKYSVLLRLCQVQTKIWCHLTQFWLHLFSKPQSKKQETPI